MANQGKIVLYKLDGSPPVSVIRMIGDILGLQFELETPDFLNREHKSSEYKKKNPMGTVPVLIDGDFIISESHATAKYLLSKYGGNHNERLYPSNIKTRALLDQCLFFNAGVLFLRLREVTLPTIYEGLKRPTEKNIQGIEDGYSVLEAYLQDRDYLACEHLTLADISLGATTNALQAIHKLDQNKFPRTVQWLAKINQESFFKNIDLPSAATLKAMMELYWKKNNA